MNLMGSGSGSRSGSGSGLGSRPRLGLGLELGLGLGARAWVSGLGPRLGSSGGQWMEALGGGLEVGFV